MVEAAESKPQRSLSKLNAYVKGTMHTRKKQLQQAFKYQKSLVADADSSKLPKIPKAENINSISDQSPQESDKRQKERTTTVNGHYEGRTRDLGVISTTL